MLPGIDGTGELYRPLGDLLGEHFEIVVCRYPDLPDFDAYVDHAASLLPAEGPVTLLAESFSGPVAIALLARRRQRIHSAVLSATFAVSPRPLLTRLARLAPAAGLAIPALRRLVVASFAMNGSDCGAARQLIMRVTERSDPAVLLRRAAILRRVDVRESLASIEVPVLCLRAGRDRVVPARYPRMLADGLADARLVDIDAPHMLLQCRPRECAELIVDFLG